MTIIRHMKEEDIGRVYEIERKSFPYPFGETLIGNIYFSSPELCYVVMHGEDMIGFLLGGRTPEPKEVHIMSIAIIEEYPGQRWGDKLVEHFIASVKKFGFSDIRLEVQVENQVAIHLYEKFNFKKTRRIRKYYEDNSDAYVYNLKID